MKISYNWLKQYVNFNLTPNDLGEVLTGIGLEVEDIHPFQSVQGGLKNVVIGEVIDCSKHPDADKLSVTKVDVGSGELLQIVCGAPNVAAGQKVVVALVGATLYPSNGEKLAIKKAKIRGVESSGMLCAEDELGLGNSHAGIMVLPYETKVGTPAAEYFSVENDYVLEIGLTPNRGDANSHIGVARDLAAALNVSYKSKVAFQKPELSGFNFSTTNNGTIKVEVEATEACPRYTGVLLHNIQVKESPEWLKNRLKAIGVKCINNVVDITNYILHEYGQPLHAFDAKKINGNKVVVKKLPEGTVFKTLDNTDIKLHADDLMICDAEGGMCIAGVYGGLNSGVTDQTTSIFLESAYFSPTSIRQTSARHSLRTDAATHFEKGTDPNSTVEALKNAIILLTKEAGAQIASAIIDFYPSPISGWRFEVSLNRMLRLAGFDIPVNTIKSILQHLEITIEKEDGDVWYLHVPAFKTDVKREADVVEEILRIYGYNSFTLPKAVKSSLEFSPAVNAIKTENTVADLLSGFGLNEVWTNSVSQSKFANNDAEKSELVVLLNSQTAELDSLRGSLLYSGLEVIAHNQNHQQSDLRFYEFGKVYAKSNDNYSEKKELSIFITGKNFEENWIGKSEQYNFYHLKNIVLQVFGKLGYALPIATEFEHKNFSYALQLKIEDETVAAFGAVSSRLLKQFDIKREVFYANVNWAYLLEKSQYAKTSFKELPKFPAVRRDLAMILNSDITFEQIEKIAQRESKKLLREVSLFDVYKGDKIQTGKKSYAVSFVFQHEDKTLTDAEIEKTMSRLMGKLESELNAEIRKS